jgi:hypothetical protein
MMSGIPAMNKANDTAIQAAIHFAVIRSVCPGREAPSAFGYLSGFDG